MTLVALDAPRFHGLPWYQGTVDISLGVVALDAAGEKAAVCFTVPTRIPAGAKPSRVWFRTTGVSSAQDLKVSFQSLDASGDPDGTTSQYRVYPLASLSANTAHRTGLITSDGTDTGTLRTIAPGDRMAVVIEFDSSTGNVTLTNVANQTFGSFAGAYRDLFVAAWTKVGSTTSLLAIEMDDGSFLVVPGTVPFVGGSGTSDAGVNNETFNSGSSPDERGNRWVPSRAASVSGIWASLDYDNDVDLVLYGPAGTALATAAAPASAQRVSNNILIGYFPFAAAVEVAAGSVYRVVIKPAASNIVGVRCGGPAAAIASYFGAMHATTRVDAGAWTDTDTGLYMIGPVIEAEDVGGGGGRRPRMRVSA